MIITYKGGDDNTTVSSGTRIGFFGANFGDSITLGTYQSSTYATDNIASVNNGSLPNVKFVTNSTADWGSGELPLQSIPSADCTLHIRLTSGSTFRVQAIKLIAHSGSNVASPPKDIIVNGAEQGDLVWTRMNGSAAPLMLTPHIVTSAAIHDYYVSLSSTVTKHGSNISTNFTLYLEWY